MAKQTINLGTGELTGDGESIRSAFDKVNDNFDEVYARDLNTDAQTLSIDGNTISITGGNSVTIAPAVSLDGDLTGSVFGDDSTLLVDGVSNKIVGPVDTASVDAVSLRTSATSIALGRDAGKTNQANLAVAIGSRAGYTGQALWTVAVGTSAGSYDQGMLSTAVGYNAGSYDQGGSATAIGYSAGAEYQGNDTVAVGAGAGTHGQENGAVAVGFGAATGNVLVPSYVSGGTGGAALVVDDTTGIYPGFRLRGTGFTTQTVVSVDSGTTLTLSADASQTPTNDMFFLGGQGIDAIAIGKDAAAIEQSTSAIAIGKDAGKTTQGQLAIAIGHSAGLTAQNGFAVAIGTSAGLTNQSTKAVAVGDSAGSATQGEYSVAVGNLAGQTTQGANAVAVGRSAGVQVQGASAVAIGYEAGSTGQGANAIAIGEKAGYANQAANSIVINATGAEVYNTGASSLIITPVRNAVGTTAVMYDATTGEVTHTATPSFSITGNAATATNVAYSGLTGTAPTWDQDTTGTAAIATTFTVADEGTDTTCFPVFATAATGNVGGKTDSVLTYNSSNGTLSATAFVGNITGDAAGDHTGTFTGNVFTNLIDSADSSAIVITPSLRTSSDVTIDQELRVGSQNTFGPNGKSVAIIPSYDTGTGKVSTDTLEVRAIQITDVDGGIITLTGELDISKTLTTNAGHLGFGDNNLLAYSGVSASLRVAEFTGDLDQAGDFENAANFNNYMTVDSTVADFGTAVKFASMTTGVRNALTPAAGMVVFNTTETKLQVYTGSAWEDLH